MAHFFALLLALLQAPAPPSPSPSLALDARWVVRFDSPPATPPGYDATTAYIPLKDGKLVGTQTISSPKEFWAASKYLILVKD